MFRSVLALALVASAAAVCDNACSGHGTCMTDDVCNCYDNWGIGIHQDSGDCSERKCPYELAWVDTPDKVGAFHKYAECAGRGICDRGTGECACFDGYEGKGCQRTTCPNDCSGHGTCEYIEDMAFAATWGDYSNQQFRTDAKTFDFNSWDAGKTRGCVCDAQYGDVDCSKRMCPYGNDVLDVRDVLTVAEKQQIQELRFISENASPISDSTGGVTTLRGETFALTFKSRLNETFTTIPIVFDDADLPDFVNDIQLALLNLPNRVIDGVSVSAYKELTALTTSGSLNNGNAASSTSDHDGLGTQTIGVGDVTETDGILVSAKMNDMIRVVIQFTGEAVQGPQHLISVEDYECSNGCTPKITGLSLQYRHDHATNNVTETELADFNSYECGRRGKCDYDSGLCECFTGYSGDNCNTLTTLV
jgi:hypothetical protein